MRSDHYARHMKSHIRLLLSLDNDMHKDCIENKNIVIYHKATLQNKNYNRFYYTFGICLGCGKHMCCYGGRQDTNMKGMRTIYHGERPFRKDVTEVDKCAFEVWKDDHNLKCAASYDRVKDWFDFTVKQPALTEKAKTSTATYLPRKQLTKSTKTVDSVDTKAIKDNIARTFSYIFDKYFYTSDDEETLDSEDDDYEDLLDERKDDREQSYTQKNMTIEDMLKKIKESYDYQCSMVKRNVTKAIKLQKDNERLQKIVDKYEKIEEAKEVVGVNES